MRVEICYRLADSKVISNKNNEDAEILVTRSKRRIVQVWSSAKTIGLCTDHLHREKKVTDFPLTAHPHTMTAHTHNEFLDIPASDDEVSDRGYDSETNATESKGRAVKRRRQDFFNLQSDDDELDEDEENEDADSRADLAKGRKKTKTEADLTSEDDQTEGGVSLTPQSPSSKKATKSTSKPLKVPKKKKTGVIYLSSLPPYLKPHSLKKMIEARGFVPITKIFLAPLLPSSSGPKRRGNKRKLYTDGWIEFASKKTAKIAAETLNANIIGVRPTDQWEGFAWSRTDF